MLRKTEGRKRRERQRVRQLYGIIHSMDMSLSKLQEIIRTRKSSVLQSMGQQRVRQDLVTEQQQQQPSHSLYIVLKSLLPGPALICSSPELPRALGFYHNLLYLKNIISQAKGNIELNQKYLRVFHKRYLYQLYKPLSFEAGSESNLAEN